MINFPSIADRLSGTAGNTVRTTLGGAPLTSLSRDSQMTRNSQMPELGRITGSVNLLAQAASALSAGSGAADQPLLGLPPLPPMPAPAKAPDIPTDDHGQSNIVFADADADGTLIH